MKFTVIDTKTGKYPDMWDISINEEWAQYLMYCDMEGFAIREDGTMILLDERLGQFVDCPEGRFEVVLDESNEPLTLEQLRLMDEPTPVWWDWVSGWVLARKGMIVPWSGRCHEAEKLKGNFYRRPPARK